MMEIRLRQPYSFCQIGRRTNQEDARYPDKDIPIGFKPAFIVCDGVGGQDKGEVASHSVAEAFGTYMSKRDLAESFTSADFAKALEYAYSKLDLAMKNGGHEMATTFTFLCVHRDGVFCAHMGDSRIYHIRPDVGILYRSDDNSLVNELVHTGGLTPEEAINHSRSNVITRSMGYVASDSEKPSASTYQIEDIEAGDYFFLCTDGVLHSLEDSELFNILSSDISDKDKINIIAEKSRGSNDNNTAYLIGVDCSTGKGQDEGELKLISSDTHPLPKQNQTIKEVSIVKRHHNNKFSQFFKNLF